MPPLEWCEEWPVEAGERLLPPGANLDLLDSFGPEVPDCFLRDGLWQEKHWIEGPLAERQDALGQVPAEPAKPAVSMPQFLKIEHNARPSGTSLLCGPLRDKSAGEHG